MTTHPQLDSAAAVEVAAFCYPDGKWEAVGDPHGAFAVIFHRDGQKWKASFDIEDWADLHRAAAVLVGRGFAPVMSRHLIREEWPVTAGGDFVNWLLTAPADAWARAILATVREAAKA